MVKTSEGLLISDVYDHLNGGIVGGNLGESQDFKVGVKMLSINEVEVIELSCRDASLILDKVKGLVEIVSYEGVINLPDRKEKVVLCSACVDSLRHELCEEEVKDIKLKVGSPESIGPTKHSRDITD